MAGRYQSRASQRYRAVVARDEGSPIGQLRETAIRQIQRGALRDFGSRPNRALAKADGLSISVDVLTSAELQALSSNRTLRAAWNKVVQSFAQLVQERARKLSRPAYDTGLFSSSWKTTATGSGAKLKITLSNRAPYTKYVHFAGTPRNRTVLKTEIEPMVQRAQVELLNELTSLRGPMLDAIRRATLAGRA